MGCSPARPLAFSLSLCMQILLKGGNRQLARGWHYCCCTAHPPASNSGLASSEPEVPGSKISGCGYPAHLEGSLYGPVLTSGGTRCIGRTVKRDVPGALC